MWNKIAKFIIGLLLIPACAGGVRTLWFLLNPISSADVVWVPLIGGIGCWLIVYVLLPKPMLIYVFGHELTHAFWAWIFGGKLKRFKATSKGGYVVVTKDNFVISLAPYFFPIYAIIVVVLYMVGDIIWDFHKYRSIFHILLGAAYAFHITFTIYVLAEEQPDILLHGRLFSIAVIFLGNILVLVIALPVLGDFSVITSLRFWLNASITFYGWVYSTIVDLIFSR